MLLGIDKCTYEIPNWVDKRFSCPTKWHRHHVISRWRYCLMYDWTV